MTFLLTFLDLESGVAHLKTEDLFLQNVVPSRHREVKFPLFMGGFNAALMKQHNHLCLLNSGSRDKEFTSH